MDKYIGFDIAYKKTVACVVQRGQPDKYDTLPTDVNIMRQWLEKQRKPSDRLHLTFEMSGQSGWLYDSLRDRVDSLTVSNPSQMTWIYRTAKKSDRIDARKQAVLCMMNELPQVHMPGKEVRQWHQQIQHRRNVCSLVTQTKNRTRALLRSQGIQQPAFTIGWWSLANRNLMRQLMRFVNKGESPKNTLVSSELGFLIFPASSNMTATDRVFKNNPNRSFSFFTAS